MYRKYLQVRIIPQNIFKSSFYYQLVELVKQIAVKCFKKNFEIQALTLVRKYMKNSSAYLFRETIFMYFEV